MPEMTGSAPFGAAVSELSNPAENNGTGGTGLAANRVWPKTAKELHQDLAGKSLNACYWPSCGAGQAGRMVQLRGVSAGCPTSEA